MFPSQSLKKKEGSTLIVVNCFFDNVGNLSKEEPLDSPLASKTYEQPTSPTRTSF